MESECDENENEYSEVMIVYVRESEVSTICRVQYSTVKVYWGWSWREAWIMRWRKRKMR